MKEILKKKSIHFLILCLVMAMGLTLAGCSSNDEDDKDADYNENGYMAYVVFDSDSDNGIVWTCELSNDKFTYEDMLLEDEAYEGEGSGEEQDFFLYPVTEGQTTATFTSTDANGVAYEYVYTLTADKELKITVDSAEGTAGGQPAEAPSMIVDAIG